MDDMSIIIAPDESVDMGMEESVALPIDMPDMVLLGDMDMDMASVDVAVDMSMAEGLTAVRGVSREPRSMIRMLRSRSFVWPEIRGTSYAVNAGQAAYAACAVLRVLRISRLNLNARKSVSLYACMFLYAARPEQSESACPRPRLPLGHKVLLVQIRYSMHCFEHVIAGTI